MIAVVSAMEEELAVFVKEAVITSEERRGPLHVREAVVNDREVILCVSGIGKILSACAVQFLSDRYPLNGIIHTGIAGALNDIPVGDMVAGEKVLQWDFDARPFTGKIGSIPRSGIRTIPADPALLHAAMAVETTGFTLRRGLIVTGDRFVADKQEPGYRFLTEELNGDAVDMESAAVGITARLNGVDFLCLKVISDDAEGNKPKRFKKFIRTASERSFLVVTGMFDRLF